MTQRNLRGKELEYYKKVLQLTDVQKEVLIGTLLGDASMSLRDGRPHYSVKFEQGAANAAYIEHLYQIFEQFTGSPPKYRFIDNEQKRRALWFRTYRHDQLIFYWNLFYRTSKTSKVRKVKIVPINISKFLTPRAVAYWFMDDGNLTSNFRSFVLNTQGFEKHESKILCEVLRKNFNIIASVNKDKEKWRIYIWQESAETFRTLVKPYVLDCFAYKLAVSQPSHPSPFDGQRVKD